MKCMLGVSLCFDLCFSPCWHMKSGCARTIHWIYCSLALQTWKTTNLSMKLFYWINLLFMHLWLIKGTLISHVSLTPLTIINQPRLWPTLKSYSFTVVSLITHLCDKGVFTQLTHSLSGTKDGSISDLFAQVGLGYLFALWQFRQPH